MAVRGKRVTFDAFPDSVFRYLDYDAVVCVDIIRATTTLVTAVAQGRRTYPVASAGEALEFALHLGQPLLAGEMNGERPAGFEMQNSPAAIARRNDIGRPLVLLSSIGTELIVNAGACRNAYVVSLRNLTATAEFIFRRHDSVAVLAACSRGQLRCEDEMGSAWLIERLIESGFEAEDPRTSDLVKRWSGADPALMRWSSSAEYLKRSGQLDDLEFVVKHVDDLDIVCKYSDGEVKRVREVSPTVWTDDFLAIRPARPATSLPEDVFGIFQATVKA